MSKPINTLSVTLQSAISEPPKVLVGDRLKHRCVSERFHFLIFFVQSFILLRSQLLALKVPRLHAARLYPGRADIFATVSTK